jgi:hypothetical protein
VAAFLMSLFRHREIFRSDVIRSVRERLHRGPRPHRPDEFPVGYTSAGFAVGMTIADHPPHRSVLAELPHTAPPLDSSVEANIGIRMKSSWARYPSIEDRPQLLPIGLPPLAATT